MKIDLWKNQFYASQGGSADERRKYSAHAKMRFSRIASIDLCGTKGHRPEKPDLLVRGFSPKTPERLSAKFYHEDMIKSEKIHRRNGEENCDSFVKAQGESHGKQQKI